WQDLLAVLKANFDEKANAIDSSIQDAADEISRLPGLVQDVATRLGQLPGVTSPVRVSLQASDPGPTEDQVLWSRIRNSAQNMSFNNYRAVIDSIMCNGSFPLGGNEEALRPGIQPNRCLPFPDVDGYRLLKVATEVFVMANAGVMQPGVVNTNFPPVTNQVTFNVANLTDESARLRRTVTNASLQTDWNTLVNNT